MQLWLAGVLLLVALLSASALGAAPGELREQLNALLANPAMAWAATLLTALTGLWLAFRRAPVARDDGSAVRWRAVFQRNADALLLLDAQGRLVDANERALSSFGCDLQQLVASHWGQLSNDPTPNAQREFLGHLQRALDGSEACFDWQARARDRRPFWVEVRLRSLLIDNLPHVLASLHDIGQRRLHELQLSDSERLLRTLSEGIPGIAHCVIDRERRVLHWSDGCRQLYGYSAAEARAQPLEQLLLDSAQQNRLRHDLNARLRGDHGDADCETQPRQHRDGGLLAVLSCWRRQLTVEGNPELVITDIDPRRIPLAGGDNGDHAMHLAAEVTLELLRNRNPQQAVQQVMPQIAEALSCDRIQLIQLTGGDDGIGEWCSWRVDWRTAAAAQFREQPVSLQSQSIETQFPHWMEDLRAGCPRQGFSAQQPEPERSHLLGADDTALLATPIAIDDHLWGFVVLERLNAASGWSPRDQRVLSIVGAALATALDRRLSEERLRQSAKVFDSTHDAVLVTDLDGRIIKVNRAFCVLTGYGEIDVIGRNPRLLQSGRHDHAFYEQMWHTLRSKGHWRGEIWNRRRNGELYPQWLDISTVLDDEGLPSHYVGIGADISQLKRSEQQLEHLAHHDPLTGLPNRLLAYSRLEHALEGADRSGSKVGVLFIDLDGFKRINDSLGHASGDTLLVDVANRLRYRTRNNDTLARLGGDEFLIIAESLGQAADARQIARKLIKALEQPFYVDGREVFLGAAIGISLYPGNGNTSEELLRNADTAMYQAKSAGRNQVCEFTQDMNSQALALLELDSNIRNALQFGNFELHFQPKYDLKQQRIAGFEALLRMRTPEGERVSPDRFIGMAERTGMIVPIGAWVLREACKEAKRWHDAGHPGIVVAVNVSARQFRESPFIDEVRHALSRSGLPAECLELELTESLLMDDPSGMVERMHALKSLGLRLALDDFGTGYSSLGYLLRFPIDTLKIDKSFVTTLGRDPHAGKIVISIVDLARRMRLKLVAEGVETLAQAEFMRNRHCDEIQGYLVSRPVDGEAALALLDEARVVLPVEGGSEHALDGR